MTIEGAVRDQKVNVEMFGGNLEKMITQGEKWIHRSVFDRCVKQRRLEEQNVILFFVAKATQVVTLHTNAYHYREKEVIPLTEYDATCTMIGSCECIGDSICDNHQYSGKKVDLVPSPLPPLRRAVPFPCPVSGNYKYMMFAQNDRSVIDIFRTESMKYKLREMVSALANSGGGSLLLGVTDTDTPIVEGFLLYDTTRQHLDETLTDALGGTGSTDGMVWSNCKLSQRHWDVFIHSIQRSEKGRSLIEIRHMHCPGGVFCAVPRCFEVSESGDIRPLVQFEEWKDRMLKEFRPEHVKAEGTLDGHFETGEVISHHSPQVASIHTPQHMHTVPADIQHGDNPTSHLTPLWLSTGDIAKGASYQFDHCCAKELADDAINIRSPFHLVPAIQEVPRRHGNMGGLASALTYIEQKYRDDNGVGCVIDDILDACNITQVSLPRYHVTDVVILRENQRPSICCVMERKGNKTDAEQYITTLAAVMKRVCLLKLRTNDVHLSFQCHIYYIGSVFESLQEKVNMPGEYIEPTSVTLNAVRYVLAGIFLRCDPIKDRFGDIIVKHLSSCQAKLLLRGWCKVNLVEGRAGSGKTVLILETMRRIAQRGTDCRILFLCRSRGLASFVRYQSSIMVTSATIETVNVERNEQVTEGCFSEFTDIFIDDAHTLPMSAEPNCQKMYDSLFATLQKTKSSLYIFLDPKMQDYRGCIPPNFAKQIRSMARKYNFSVRTESIGKVLRNSHHICRFVNSNMGDEELEEIQAVRNVPDDNVFFFYIQGLACLFLPAFNVLLEKQYDSSSTSSPTSVWEDENVWVRMPEYMFTPIPLLPKFDALLTITTEEPTHHDGEGHDHSDDSEYDCRVSDMDSSNSSEDNLSDLDLSDRMCSDDSQYGMRGNGSTDSDDSSYGCGYDAFNYISYPSEDEDIIPPITIVTRLKNILGYGRYSESHIVILTATTDDKKLTSAALQSHGFSTQDASTFPLAQKRLVVDTLENFEGLESPVVLFIVPECWGKDYIGSLKYRLCIATRAISRLEFLVPWDPTGRERDLAELKKAFQSEVTFS